MWPTTKTIMPIVSNQTTEENHWFDFNTLSQWWMPTTWMDFVTDTNTQKDSEGNFIVAKNLEKFLRPYRHCLNTPDTYSKHRIFSSFFVQVYHKNSNRKNEIHLSKVIVLLKLLVDPNLPVSTSSICALSLGNIFEKCPIGFDALNLLFSYGYSYERFLIGLQIYVYEQIDEKRIIDSRDQYVASTNDHAFIQKELNNTAESKDSFAHQYGIDRRMLDIAEDNPYIQVFQALRNAYKAYQASDHKTAGNLYQKAYRLLRILKQQDGLSDVIKKDYQRRYEESKQYYAICRESLTFTKQLPEEHSPLLKLSYLNGLNKVSVNNSESSHSYSNYKKFN